MPVMRSIKNGVSFSCAHFGKMSSIHAIKMTHTHTGMMRCVLHSWLVGLMFCISVNVQLRHLSPQIPFIILQLKRGLLSKKKKTR